MKLMKEYLWVVIDLSLFNYGVGCQLKKQKTKQVWVLYLLLLLCGWDFFKKRRLRILGDVFFFKCFGKFKFLSRVGKINKKSKKRHWQMWF